MNPRFIAPVIVLFAAIAIFFLSKPTSMKEVHIQTAATLYNLLVDVAKTPKQHQEGLMDRDSLPDQEGMLFVYDHLNKPGFWMKNMKIPLDILFVGEDLIIKDIEKNVPPCEQDKKCQLYNPSEPIKYVLELRGGFTEDYGVKAGDLLIMDLN